MKKIYSMLIIQQEIERQEAIKAFLTILICLASIVAYFNFMAIIFKEHFIL